MVGGTNWEFIDYYYELMYISHRIHVPELQKYRVVLIEEMLKLFPQKCIDYNITKE